MAYFDARKKIGRHSTHARAYFTTLYTDIALAAARRRMDGKLLWTRQYDMFVTKNKRILATILTPELEKILSRNHDEKVIWHLLEMGLSKQS